MALRPPDWQPSTSECNRLLAFQGYGPEQPEVIFLGLEERCEEDLELQMDNLWLRCCSPVYDAQRIDKNAAMALLTAHGVVSGELVRVWKTMAMILACLHARSKESDPEKDWRTEYQTLGSRPPHGGMSSLLTELRPLPLPPGWMRKTTYLGRWSTSEFHGAAEYLAYADRTADRRLRAVMNAHFPPRFLFGYGEPVRRRLTEYLRKEGAPPPRGCLGKKYIEVSRTPTGTTVALTGFYGGQPNPSTFNRCDIPALVQAACDVSEG